MQREKLAIVCSGFLFGLTIVTLPNQFLFSKTVPNSFWTEYFPLLFGAGWFITFIVLIPAIALTLGGVILVLFGVFFAITANNGN